MNDLPVFLQVFVRAFALLAVGLWMQTLASSQKKEREQPAEPAKTERASRSPDRPSDAPPGQHGQSRPSPEENK
ncbi:MAG: hypothetical protein ACHQ5A_08325 [Opitutales bacterium]